MGPRSILRLLILLVFVVLGYALGEIISKASFEPYRNDGYEYHDASAWMDHDKNICFSSGDFFDIEVEILYSTDLGADELDNTVIGQWQTNELTHKNTIYLRDRAGLNIETVSHEVSHMVDTMMVRYKIEDPHFRAYLQGYWTQCVWKVVEQDLLEAESL